MALHNKNISSRGARQFLTKPIKKLLRCLHNEKYDLKIKGDDTLGIIAFYL